jgi:hypothetical protein
MKRIRVIKEGWGMMMMATAAAAAVAVCRWFFHVDGSIMCAFMHTATNKTWEFVPVSALPFSYKLKSLLAVLYPLAFLFYLFYAYARTLRRATMTATVFFLRLLLCVCLCVTQWLIYYAVSNPKELG